MLTLACIEKKFYAGFHTFALSFQAHECLLQPLIVAHHTEREQTISFFIIMERDNLLYGLGLMVDVLKGSLFLCCSFSLLLLIVTQFNIG